MPDSRQMEEELGYSAQTLSLTGQTAGRCYADLKPVPDDVSMQLMKEYLESKRTSLGEPQDAAVDFPRHGDKYVSTFDAHSRVLSKFYRSSTVVTAKSSSHRQIAWAYIRYQSTSCLNTACHWRSFSRKLRLGAPCEIGDSVLLIALTRVHLKLHGLMLDSNLTRAHHYFSCLQKFVKIFIPLQFLAGTCLSGTSKSSAVIPFQLHWETLLDFSFNWVRSQESCRSTDKCDKKPCPLHIATRTSS